MVRKRKWVDEEVAGQEPEVPKAGLRKARRRTARKRARARKQRVARRRAIMLQVARRAARAKLCNSKLKVGVWNVRGLGAIHAAEDPEINRAIHEKNCTTRSEGS